jgi:hypothetical protein
VGFVSKGDSGHQDPAVSENGPRELSVIENCYGQIQRDMQFRGNPRRRVACGTAGAMPKYQQGSHLEIGGLACPACATIYEAIRAVHFGIASDRATIIVNPKLG